jgi:molybdopterin biosynthesis enzyme
MVTFHLFVRPAIARWMGAPPVDSVCAAVLEADVAKHDDRRYYVPAVAEFRGGTPLVRPCRETFSSGALSAAAGANCLIVLPESARSVRAGEQVEIDLLDAPPRGFAPIH